MPTVALIDKKAAGKATGFCGSLPIFALAAACVPKGHTLVSRLRLKFFIFLLLTFRASLQFALQHTKLGVVNLHQKLSFQQ